MDWNVPSLALFCGARLWAVSHIKHRSCHLSQASTNPEAYFLDQRHLQYIRAPLLFPVTVYPGCLWIALLAVLTQECTLSGIWKMVIVIIAIDTLDYYSMLSNY